MGVARLLISCSDRPGIVAAVSRFLFEHGANILDADQHSTDPAGGTFLINIHHSFLPAFAGADPHRRASERGVKIIGATAHYVTEQLDAGPIIEQDVVRVSHRDGLDSLVRLGRDVERTVLARAVQRHLEDRVLVHDNRTVVF